MKEKDLPALIESAKKNYNKADKYFALQSYKKAAKLFVKAGLEFEEADEYLVAEKIYSLASDSYGFLKDYENRSEYERKAAGTCIILNEIKKAKMHFDLAARYALLGREDKNRDFNTIVMACFSYLCLFLLGRQDEGMNYLKSIKRKIDSFTFKENLLVLLIKNISIAIRDRKEKPLRDIENNFERYKFRPAEGKLIKFALILANSHILIEINFDFQKKEYTSDEKIEFSFEVDTNKLKSISENTFLDFKIEKILFSKMGIAQSDNLSVTKRPKFPLELKPGDKTDFEIAIAPNFPNLKSFIGPILITCQINDLLTFFLKTNIHTIKITSPPPQLGVYFKQLKPPIINQTFPMEITISNKSTGEAVEVNIYVEFPEGLKVMRGTTTKQIYSIRPQEEVKWEVQIKPLEPGDYNIKTNVKYVDGDGNLTDKTKDFPLEIKL